MPIRSPARGPQYFRVPLAPWFATAWGGGTDLLSLLGTGRALEEMKTLKNVLVSMY